MYELRYTISFDHGFVTGAGNLDSAASPLGRPDAFTTTTWNEEKEPRGATELHASHRRESFPADSVMRNIPVKRVIVDVLHALMLRTWERIFRRQLDSVVIQEKDAKSSDVDAFVAHFLREVKRTCNVELDLKRANTVKDKEKGYLHTGDRLWVYKEPTREERICMAMLLDWTAITSHAKCPAVLNTPIPVRSVSTMGL